MTILIVDDNEQNLYQLQIILAANGYQVVCAVNGADALAKARKAPPALIVSDILMPAMDGFALCREWKKDQRLRSIPFIFFTATYSDGQDREFGLGLGAERFLVKPEDQDIIVQTIREILQKDKRSAEADVPARLPIEALHRIPVETLQKEEVGYLQQYNATLIRKLEDKMKQLEKANRELEIHIAELKRAEETRERTLEWQKGAGMVQHALLATAPLEEKLRRVTEGIVRVFDADFCRIWLIRPGDLCERNCIHAGAHEGPHVCRFRDRCLHLAASSGRYTHIDGKTHCRVPFGCYKIGHIAADNEEKYLTNNVQDDPWVHDKKWARKLGLLSFAGYKLRVPDGETLGVMALFAKHPIVPAEDAILDGLGSAVSLGVRQAIAEDVGKLLQAQLIQSQKMESIGTLASGVAHEINNPITVVMSYAQLIANKAGPDSPVAKDAYEIGKAADHVAAIVKNLLSFARLDKQEHRPARTCDIVADTLSLIGAVMRIDQVEVEVNVPEDLPSILCHSQQIQQVIMNLLTNGRDALNGKYPRHHANKKIVISASKIGSAERGPGLAEEKSPREWVRLTIEDHGSGIPENLCERIFDPFFTTKPRDKGTGLGLSISHGIVKDHGGLLWFESKAGEWTRFHVDLPAALATESRTGMTPS